MKIVCDSCGAKYSIADEKVAGRVFKIRCKKCGAAIVVKGDAGQAAEAAPAAGGASFDYGGEAVWHTVVEGEQQGPFAPAQLGSMISAGTIGWDAYVWREGFDDWKPAQDIEELVQAIMNPGGAPAAGGAAEDPFSDQPTVGVGGGAKSSPAPAAKAAKRDAGADLFAQSEASPFGGGGDDDDVVASAPSPRVGGNQAMTGARNENSVLFSLSNLQALATGSPGGGGSASPSPSSSSKASGPAPKAGMAAGEGSGLIDIRALASATGLTGGGGGLGSGPSLGSAPPKLDELISIGAPTGGLGGALGAPVIIAEKPEPARGGGGGMIAAAAIVAVALLGGAGIFAYVSLNQPDPAATAPATAAIAPTAPPPASAVAAPPPTTTVAAADPAAAGATTPPPASTAGSTGGGSRRPRTGGGGGSTGGTTASADPAPAPSGGGTARPSGGGSGGDRSIDALLEGALGPTTARRPAGGGGGTAPAPSGGGGASDASLPASPARGDVMTAMTSVRSDVVACGGGQHGLATVAVGVTGSTGRVSSATVSGQFAGTPIGSCVARAVRGATFPHFRNPTFSFNFPFQL